MQDIKYNKNAEQVNLTNIDTLTRKKYLIRNKILVGDI